MSNWTETEKEILYDLKQTGEKSAKQIAKELKNKGYPSRTPSAVRSACKRNLCLIENIQETEIEDEKESSLIIETKPKILYFDIETTDFKADFGEIICMGYRWHYEDEYKITKINDFEGWKELPVEQRDKYVVEHITYIIAEADVLVGHYSKRFDHRFIQTRCIMHGLKVIPDTQHVDTWAIAKYQMAFSRNSMKIMADRLGCGEQKDHVNWRIWRRLKAHDEEAINTIAEYCIQDVKTQYDMTQKLLPLAKTMPNMNILTDEFIYRCSGCGSNHIQKRGYHCTKVNKYQRLQCMNCGKWSRGRSTVLDKNIERQMY